MSSRSRGPPPKIEGMTSLKIDNVSSRTGPSELRKAFEKYGEIGDIHIPRDPWTGDSKGFAFIRYYSRRDAEDAMDQMDGRRVDGREIRVVMARYGRPMDDRDGGARGSRRRPRSPSSGRSRSRSRDRDRDRERSRERRSRRRHRSRSGSRSRRSRSSRSRYSDKSKSSSRSASVGSRSSSRSIKKSTSD